MGAGIAEVCARAGSSVVIVEADPDAAGRCRNWIFPVERMIRDGKITQIYEGHQADRAHGDRPLAPELGADELMPRSHA